MIESHFESVREKIAELGWLTDRVSIESEYDEDNDIGMIGGRLTLKDGSVFHFKEVFVRDFRKYRFHYMDSRSNLIIRWDNAPHHRDVKTFPHHVHYPDGVDENEEIGFAEALDRIEDIVIRQLDEY